MGESEETTCRKMVTMMQVMTLTHTARNLIQEKSFVLKKGLDCEVAYECTIVEGLACEIAYECTVA